MRIGKVVGKVSLVKAHPTLVGKRWVIAVPQSLAALLGSADSFAGPEPELTALDELGASPGALIGMPEGAEAAFPFFPERKPVDCYVACILDELKLAGDAAALAEGAEST